MVPMAVADCERTTMTTAALTSAQRTIVRRSSDITSTALSATATPKGFRSDGAHGGRRLREDHHDDRRAHQCPADHRAPLERHHEYSAQRHGHAEGVPI